MTSKFKLFLGLYNVEAFLSFAILKECSYSVVIPTVAEGFVLCWIFGLLV